MRLEAVDLDVDRVPELRDGGRLPATDDGRERLVARHLPPDPHRLGWHAPARLQGLRGQPRPEHDAVGLGVSRGDAQAERIGGELRPVDDLPADPCRQERDRRHRRQIPHELAPFDPVPPPHRC
jgi:hypothetical protein